MSRLGCWWLSAALGVTGCGVPLNAPEQQGPVNTCSTSSTCGPGASCAQGICVATSYDLDGLLIEVRPHANAPFGATTSFVLDPSSVLTLSSQGPSGAPFFATYDPVIPALVHIDSGTVYVSTDTPLEATCKLDPSRAVPAVVSFFRTPRFAALPVDLITASTDATKANKLDVELVPDTYDVYVEPLPYAGCNQDKAYPPAFFPGQAIGGGAPTSWQLPVAHGVSGSITDFGAGLGGSWKIEVIEPKYGLPISSSAELTKGLDGYAYAAQLAWTGADAPILRVTPPSGVVLPTVYWSLPKLAGGVTSDVEVTRTVSGLFKGPVWMGGHILGTDSFTNIPASLTIQSIVLPGPNGENASFAIQRQSTDGLGAFSVLLPPADSYDFRIFPVDSGLAVTDVTRGIPEQAGCFCAQTLQLQPKPRLSGVVKTPAGERFAGAPVELSGSVVLPKAFWESVHALSPFAVRAVSTSTSNDGNFEILVDPGLADVTVKPSPGSMLPWFVRPLVSVKDDAVLPPLQLTSPAVLSGLIRDPSGAPVTDALVNAWYMVRDPSAPRTAVKIATTSTDENGNYLLVMPSSI